MGSAISETNDYIKGATDGTEIGNTGDRLKVDTAGAASATLTRTDLSGAFTATGNTGALDTIGFSNFAIQIAVTASSGTNRTLDLELQASDDGTNWEVVHTFPRFTTATGFQRITSIRICGKYYRLVYTIAGTTPSFTFSVITTMKMGLTSRYTSEINYNDLNINTVGNVSASFKAESCANTNVTAKRSSDGFAAVGYAVDGSPDGTIWFAVTGNNSVASGATVAVSLSGYAYRFYRARCSNAIGSSGVTIDLYWCGNGGS